MLEKRALGFLLGYIGNFCLKDLLGMIYDPVMWGFFTGIGTNHQKRNPMIQSAKRKVRGFFLHGSDVVLAFFGGL